MLLGSKLSRTSWGRDLMFGEESKVPKTWKSQCSPQKHAAADWVAGNAGTWCLHGRWKQLQKLHAVRSRGYGRAGTYGTMFILTVPDLSQILIPACNLEDLVGLGIRLEGDAL
jgi:hypothetical protein